MRAGAGLRRLVLPHPCARRHPADHQGLRVPRPPRRDQGLDGDVRHTGRLPGPAEPVELQRGEGRPHHPQEPAAGRRPDDRDGHQRRLEAPAGLAAQAQAVRRLTHRAGRRQTWGVFPFTRFLRML
ncbi:hypothetical protein SBRY_30468 [Actinacidiphila bryophytorum]|uniref:Uncharacterized protein n=1 Tax=Actinacidiphila bryophytorum TaxID=1436133 RepID=A0A9W4MBF8_9ACTN|nr:hypothetical protein SBRY_30468 [Actinacidiphila bryophytorum]